MQMDTVKIMMKTMITIVTLITMKVNMIAKVQMERKIVELEDDMKEYWGFYLLKHSHYK